MTGGGRLGLVLVALATGGCSFLFVTPAPANHAEVAYMRCTRHYASPIVDTAMASTMGLVALGIASETNQESTLTPQERHNDALGWGITAAVVGASAIYGYATVGTCRAAVDAMLERRYANPRYLVVPPGYAYPPPGYAYPPPGYAYPPPAPGYPPPGYPPAPGYPPPSYPPPPAAAPPPRAPAPPPTPRAPAPPAAAAPALPDPPIGPTI